MAVNRSTNQSGIILFDPMLTGDRVTTVRLQFPWAPGRRTTVGDPQRELSY